MSKQTLTETLDPFTLAYIEAALWSSTDDEGNPLDANYTADDLAPETVDTIIADCRKFQADNAEDIASGCTRGTGEYSTDEQAGHDFWLTRNGHGAGFWDGDWTEPHATRLTGAAQAFGSVDLYVGDDGQIHC